MVVRPVMQLGRKWRCSLIVLHTEPLLKQQPRHAPKTGGLLILRTRPSPSGALKCHHDLPVSDFQTPYVVLSAKELCPS